MLRYLPGIKSESFLFDFLRVVWVDDGDKPQPISMLLHGWVIAHHGVRQTGVDVVFLNIYEKQGEKENKILELP